MSERRYLVEVVRLGDVVVANNLIYDHWLRDDVGPLVLAVHSLIDIALWNPVFLFTFCVNAFMFDVVKASF